MLSKLYLSLFGELDYKTVILKIFGAILIFVCFEIVAVIYKKNAVKLMKLLFKVKNENFTNAFVASIAKPFNFFLRATGIYLALRYIPFCTPIGFWLYPILLRGFRICLIVLVSISVQNFIVNFSVFFEHAFDGKNQTVVSFFTKVGRAAIIVLTLVIVLKELGYDINGLIAGLGLGGLTFALAAQDTASNFFSGIVILLDKPFAIGDWISLGGMEGVVEEMNFRSCRIRTFDNALISMPNSKLSSDSVTNWTKMNLRKTKISIGLDYSTKKEVLQKICDDIRAKLNSYSEIKKDTILVWFDNFNPSSLGVVIQYHAFTISQKDHLDLRQRVHFMIMDIVNNSETSFAFETRTVIQHTVTD